MQKAELETENSLYWLLKIVIFKRALNVPTSSHKDLIMHSNNTFCEQLYNIILCYKKRSF